MNKLVVNLVLSLLLIPHCQCIFADNSVNSDVTDKINNYFIYIDSVIEDNPDTALSISKKALDLSFSVKDYYLIAKSNYFIARCFFNEDDFFKSQNHFNKALYDSIVLDEWTTADCKYFIGKINYFTASYDEALENLYESLSAFKQLDDKEKMASAYQNIGMTYYAFGDIDKTLDCYKKSLELFDKIGDEKKYASVLHNIGIVHYKNEEYDIANQYYQKTLKVFVDLDFNDGIASTYSNIGLLNEVQEKYDTALIYYQKALDLFTKSNYVRGIVFSNYNLGSVYENLGNMDKSEKHFIKTMEMAKEYGFKENLVDSYEALSNLYELNKKPDLALNYYKMYDALLDSMNSIRSIKKITEIESKYDIELKEQELQSTTSELKQKTILFYVSTFGVTFLFVVIAIILIENQQKKRAQEELEKHRDQLEVLVKQRTAELKLEMSERKIAEESDKLKSAFLANMSHEIRTPMNSIIAFSNFLKEPDLSKSKREEYIQYIRSCGKNLLQLIDDIIDTAKLESKQLKIKKTPCDINKLLKELYNVFKESKASVLNNIKLELDESNLDKNYTILTDEQRLKQILSNLIENAFKYSNKGTIKFGFTEFKDGLLKFYVSDTGIGISGNKLKLIFERFGQVELALDKKTGGTGLGLAISRSLVNLLGGKIWVVSKYNQGSSFCFTLPYKGIEKTDTSLSNKKNKNKQLNYNWQNKNLLIAEDEDLNYKVLEIALKRTGINIIRATNGIDAIKFFQNNKIDLVLMDIQMPMMDGYNATRRIKEINPTIPVIAQTSFAMAEDKEKCLEAGCSDYLSKPINLEEMLEKMDKEFVNISKKQIS